MTQQLTNRESEVGIISVDTNFDEGDTRRYGAKWDGAANDSAAIRTALSIGVPVIFEGYTTNAVAIVSADPASAFDDGGATRYGWAIRVPSNSVLVFKAGATIKLANGAQKWTRLISFADADNVKVFGELKVDANVANLGASTNEHMHGVFFFNTTNTYVERIDSRNARGDNIFIGGDSEAKYGKTIRIDSIRCVKAGRKNLVLHYCDDLIVGAAQLDNSTGGAAAYGGTPDGTDRHCLDVEPDGFTGSKAFVQSIGVLNTYGLGNDFTAGTSPAQGSAWVVNIGEANCIQSGWSSSVRAWQQNAITVNVGKLSITGCAGMDSSVQLFYAARLNVQQMVVSGGTATPIGALFEAAAAGVGNDNRPILSIDSLEISTTVGAGFVGRSALATFGRFSAKCAGFAYVFGDNAASASYRGSLSIDTLYTRDTGSTAVALHETFSITGCRVRIGLATLQDTRAVKASAIWRIRTGNSQGLVVGAIENPETLPLVSWEGADTYFRVGQDSFVCQGSPEGVIPASVGAIARRSNGAPGATFYVKESGTSNTGWVPK